MLEHASRQRESDYFDSRKGEEYRTLEFYVARFCKAHPDLIDLDAYAATQVVEETMMNFEDMPERENPWESYLGADDGDECRARFEVAWDSVRHIPFCSITESAARHAIARPLKPARARTKRYAHFISYVAWLQLLNGDNDICLPVEKTAEILECDPDTISSHRKLAEADGLLTKTAEHVCKKKATSFRFAVERFPELRKQS